MKRRKKLARKSSLKPKLANLRKSGRIKPKKRTKEESDRIYGPAERRAWVTTQKCLMCERVPSENAHTHSGGTGRKADYFFIIPLCHECHRYQHQHGWAKLLGLSGDRLQMRLRALSEQTEHRWQLARLGEPIWLRRMSFSPPRAAGSTPA